MSIADLVQNYGYLAVAVGSFLEGEAVLLAGSVAAYHGHLKWPLLLPIATLASFLGDLPYFFAARHYGTTLLTRYPTLQSRKERLEGRFYRHHILLVLSLRFLYGLRIAGLCTLGLSRMSSLRFLCLNFIAAAVWASVVMAAGFGIGKVIQSMLIDGALAARVSLLAVIVLCGSAYFIFSRRRRLALPRVQSGH